MPVLRPRVSGGDPHDPNGRIMVGASPAADGTLSAVTKWVPVEVIAFYEAATTPFGMEIAPSLWLLIIAGITVTFLWIAYATADAQKSSRIAWRQVVLSCFAFAFWVIGTTSPDIWVMVHTWWRPGIGAAVIALGAIALPIIDGVIRRLGLPQD